MKKHQHSLLLILLLLLPGMAFAQRHVITRPTTKPKTEQKAKPKPKPKPQRPARSQEPSSSFSTEAISDETFTVNGVRFVMKGVRGGVFTMGATPEQANDAYGDEHPAHRVAISSFRMGMTEVTQGLWQAVMGSNPSDSKGRGLPVEQVSWNDCQTFISRLNQLTGRHFRLPTEAEWEYAARGGNLSHGYIYAGSDNVQKVAWYTMNSNARTCPVDVKTTNELGLCDMSGNVWEWCQDWYGNYKGGAQTNPHGPSSGVSRVIRGGCYSSVSSVCRVASRDSAKPSHKAVNLGFRLAL